MCVYDADAFDAIAAAVAACIDAAPNYGDVAVAAGF